MTDAAGEGGTEGESATAGERATAPVATTVTVTAGQGVAAGGDSLARLPDGRVLLVEGALPGETVEVVVVDSRRDHAKGRVSAVVGPAPSRITPVCSHVAEGCGGCGWAHVDPDAQTDLAHRVVIDALRRIGRLRQPPPFLPGRRVETAGYRTTVTMAVDPDGRLAYHRPHGADLVTVGDCRVAHPLVSDLIGAVTAPGWGAVTLRVGLAGGQRLVVVDPAPAPGARSAPGDARSRRTPRRTPRRTSQRTGGRSGGRDSGGAGREEAGGGDRVRAGPGPGARGGGPVDAPADAVVVRPGGGAAMDEEVGGRWWRVSARSFFQAGPQGAELLVDAVDAAVEGALGVDDHLVDAYAGVGLLGGTIAARRRARLTAIESDRSAVFDARHNLADLDATIIAREVGAWAPQAADVVIADPARPGLGRPGVGALAGTGARRLVLVSCDPASLGRDTALLAAAGYQLATVQIVGMFPDTVHIETVSCFEVVR